MYAARLYVLLIDARVMSGEAAGTRRAITPGRQLQARVQSAGARADVAPMAASELCCGVRSLTAENDKIEQRVCAQAIGSMNRCAS